MASTVAAAAEADRRRGRGRGDAGGRRRRRRWTAGRRPGLRTGGHRSLLSSTEALLERGAPGRRARAQLRSNAPDDLCGVRKERRVGLHLDPSPSQNRGANRRRALRRVGFHEAHRRAIPAGPFAPAARGQHEGRGELAGGRRRRGDRECRSPSDRIVGRSSFRDGHLGVAHRDHHTRTPRRLPQEERGPSHRVVGGQCRGRLREPPGEDDGDQPGTAPLEPVDHRERTHKRRPTRPATTEAAPATARARGGSAPGIYRLPGERRRRTGDAGSARRIAKDAAHPGRHEVTRRRGPYDTRRTPSTFSPRRLP